MAISEAMNATLKKVEEARPEDLAGYDLVDFGSGLYMGKYQKHLSKLVEKILWLEKGVVLLSEAARF
jgi:menaquinone-dependent protoporphyrinogen IX oxidase